MAEALWDHMTPGVPSFSSSIPFMPTHYSALTSASERCKSLKYFASKHTYIQMNSASEAGNAWNLFLNISWYFRMPQNLRTLFQRCKRETSDQAAGSKAVFRVGVASGFFQGQKDFWVSNPRTSKKTLVNSMKSEISQTSQCPLVIDLCSNKKKYLSVPCVFLTTPP